MFRGITNVSLDSKGRMSIPVSYRDALVKLVVVPNPRQDERCLLLYPLQRWEEIEADIVAKPNTKTIRDLKRFFLGQAVEYVTDSNGRVLLTANLRELAKLDKKLVMVGQGDKFELWDETVWDELHNNFLDVASDEAMSLELDSIAY